MSGSIESDISSLFCVGLTGLELDDEDKRILSRGVGGIVLFARNVGTPDQVARLIRAARRYAGEDLLACVDQEGGRVARLVDGFTSLPTMRELGQACEVDPQNVLELAFQVGECLGSELRCVGFDMNFAPVLDVDTNPANPVIGDRSISRDASRVGLIGQQLINGLTSQGIIACGKHFPGHGDTAQDSHWELPRLPHSMKRLEEVELHPFQTVINNTAASITDGVAIMSAHVVFQAINPELPGTLCPEVMTGLLREKMGFAGLCISDCLEMKAIADGAAWDGTVGATVAALQAGVDMPLICHTHDVMHAALDATLQAAREERLAATRWGAARERVQRAREFRRAARASSPREFQPGRAFEVFVAATTDRGDDPTWQAAQS